MSIAVVAQNDFSSSSAYDAHRPSYPDEAVERLLQVLEIKGKHGAKVLDVGAGTGKFTQILAARAEKYNVTALEPHDSMRTALEAKGLTGVEVLNGTAENMQSLSDGCFDAVIVSQAFHWMSNMDALREINRVLKSTAVLGLIWNIEDYNAPKSWEIHQSWEEVMRGIMWSLDDGHPRFRDMQWKAVFDEQGSGNLFSLHNSDPLFGLPIGEEHFSFVRWLDKDSIWNTFTTYSQIANLDIDARAEVQKKFLQAIDSEDTKQDSDGRIAVHGQTVVVWTAKIPDGPLKNGG